MQKVNYYLQKTKIKDVYLIYMQVKHNDLKFVFSFNEKVHVDYWDKCRQRIIETSESVKSGLVNLNIMLDKLEQHFIKLYYFFLARGNVDYDRIKQMLWVYYRNTKSGLNSLRSQKYTDDLAEAYIKRVLKKSGFTDKAIAENPELILLQREIIKIKRHAKEKTSKKHPRSKI